MLKLHSVMKHCFIFIYFLISTTYSTKAQILTYAAPADVTMDSTLLQDGIRSIVEEGITMEAFPGANVLIAKEGKIIFHETYGYWTYDSLRPVQKNDIYDYASLTKIAATLPVLMQLYSQNRFDLDAPLKEYFPKMRWSNKSKLTFRAMLAHQAGLQPGIVHWRRTIKKNGQFKNRTFVQDSSKNYPVKITDDLWLHHKYKKKMYRAIKKSEIDKSPNYKYSGLIFYLLPEIIETIVKEDFESYVKREVYQKIEANTITFNPLKQFSLEQIVPTEQDTFFRRTQVHGFVHDEGAGMMGGISGNAGLFSNIEDLAKLMQLYLNKGNYNGDQIFSAAAFDEFNRYQYPQKDNRRGLGFDKPLLEYNAEESYVAERASPSSFGHSGYTGTFAWADPAHDLIVILFSNRVYPDRSYRNLYRLNIRPRLHQIVYDAILE